MFFFFRGFQVFWLYWNLIFKYKLDRHSWFFLVTSDNVGLLVHFAESHKILLYITDIDECEEGQHDCDKNADCGNRIGGYSCTCKQGYEGDGRTCKGTLDAAKLSSLVEIRECLYTIPSTDLLLLTQSLRTITPQSCICMWNSTYIWNLIYITYIYVVNIMCIYLFFSCSFIQTTHHH